MGKALYGEFFDIMDKDGSSNIAYDEFVRVIRTSGDAEAMKMTEKEISTMFAHIDVDSSGQIQKEEFVLFLHQGERRLVLLSCAFVPSILIRPCFSPRCKCYQAIANYGITQDCSGEQCTACTGPREREGSPAEHGSDPADSEEDAILFLHVWRYRLHKVLQVPRQRQGRRN